MAANLVKKWTLPIITFIIFLFIWQCVIWIGDYQPILLPGPLLVAESIWQFIITGEIFSHLGISLFRFIVGFGFAVIVGVPVGFLLGRSNAVFDAIEPLFQLIRPVSLLHGRRSSFYGLVSGVYRRWQLYLLQHFSQLFLIQSKGFEMWNHNT